MIDFKILPRTYFKVSYYILIIMIQFTHTDNVSLTALFYKVKNSDVKGKERTKDRIDKIKIEILQSACGRWLP